MRRSLVILAALLGIPSLIAAGLIVSNSARERDDIEAVTARADEAEQERDRLRKLLASRDDRLDAGRAKRRALEERLGRLEDRLRKARKRSRKVARSCADAVAVAVTVRRQIDQLDVLYRRAIASAAGGGASAADVQATQAAYSALAGEVNATTGRLNAAAATCTTATEEGSSE